MTLTDVLIKKTRPKAKSFKMFDGGGLYLEFSPEGGKWWRYKYRFGGKEKRLSLGTYPEVSLKEARDKHYSARKQLAAGINPSSARKEEKQKVAGADSFETIARECVKTYAVNRTQGYSESILRRLEADIFPWLGERPIAEIKTSELLTALRRIEDRGALETAHRIKQHCGQVFRYAIGLGCMEFDPTPGLRGALPPRREKHHAAITEPRRAGELLRAIDGFVGTFVTKSALRLLPLVFVRNSELRKAEWNEIDFENAMWRIPAERMKMKVQHLVPLCRQSLAILRELEPLTNRPMEGKPDAPRYVFPGERSRLSPMSNNTILAALRRMGYSKEEMTGHGFRSMASTLLHELGWKHQVIERQLAHAEPNDVSRAYNYAEYLPERKNMMQAWSDYLDGLKLNLNVIPFSKTA